MTEYSLKFDGNVCISNAVCSALIGQSQNDKARQTLIVSHTDREIGVIVKSLGGLHIVLAVRPYITFFGCNYRHIILLTPVFSCRDRKFVLSFLIQDIYYKMYTALHIMARSGVCVTGKAVTVSAVH